LSFTITERPVFLSDLHQADEYILAPQSKTSVKTIRYRLVKALFLLDGPTFVERQLNEYAIAGSLDSEISGIKYESFDWMLGDHLETIVLGHVQDRKHRFVNYFADGFSVIG
jgi:hypothetical protein